MKIMIENSVKPKDYSVLCKVSIKCNASDQDFYFEFQYEICAMGLKYMKGNQRAN